MTKFMMHVQLKDGRFGRVVRVLENRRLEIKFNPDEPSETIDPHEVKEIMSEDRWRQKYLKSKGVIVS